jgi:alpha-1,3-rhamnosyl/mannosyltransferase
MVELARALLAIEDDLRYTVFYTREATRAGIGKTSTQAAFTRVRPESALLRSVVAMPLAIRRSGLSVLHCQYGLPAFVDVPSVVTVHDIFVRHRPDLYPVIHRWQLLYRIPRALEQAAIVIVPSQFTQRDIVATYGVDPAKIRVTPLGVSSRFGLLPAAHLARVAAKYGLPERYVLFLGALQPRKNLERLLMAFGGLPAVERRRHPLLIAGSEAWMYDRQKTLAAPLVAEGSVRFLGYVPDDDVPALMNLASLFTFPSLSEGFGFPALEAMRCGTCVLASAAGSLPEIVGDAGVLVDPMDVVALRDALVGLLLDDGRRAALGARGRERAAEFTWSRTAAMTAAIYREVLHSPGAATAGIPTGDGHA